MVSSKREARETTHYMAHVHSKSQPPHFRPFMIIAIVLSLGLFITGLILTIVSYRPGNSSIGSDPLKIVGPVLLSIGAVAVIICLVDICRRISSDKRHVERTYSAAQMAPPPSQQHNYSHTQYAPSHGSYRHQSQGSLRMPSQSSVHNESQATTTKSVRIHSGQY